jgi:hypothetical protein
VRFAVNAALMSVPLPFLRGFLGALGCIPDVTHVMLNKLRNNVSVAVTPGGWSEPVYTAGYQLALNKLQHYLSLAVEAGATLVPVLCLGEHLVGTDHRVNGKGGDPGPCTWPTFARWVRLLLIACPPEPVHVVFGEPITPRKGESLQQLRGRYDAALLSLARQHGIEYEAVKA